MTRSDILQLLEDRGHEVLHVQPSIITEAAMKFPTHILADEGKTLLRLWEGDLVDPSVLTTSVVYKVSIRRRTDSTFYLPDSIRIPRASTRPLHVTCGEPD